jgi:hypothetical protein
MRELAGVMQRENALLRELHLGQLPALAAEKAVLAEAYELEVRAFRRSPEAAASLPVEIRATLEQATRDYRLAVRANVAALQAARGALELVWCSLDDSLAAVQPRRAVTAPPTRAGGGQVIAFATDACR